MCVAGNLLPADRKAWNRDEAAIGGHFVRLHKLIDALLDQTCKRRRETSFIFGRLAFECIINTRYLIACSSEDLFLSYRAYSLKHEYKLLNDIKPNISKRGGKELPIERRMIASILRSFEDSGVPINSYNPSGLRNWGGKNLFEKAQALGLETAYLAAFGGGSHSIHGNWQDLLEYHLEKTVEGHFRPIFEWHRPRPQLLNAIALHSTETVIDYIKWLTRHHSEELVSVLRDLQDRIVHFDRLHEEFITTSNKKGA